VRYLREFAPRRRLPAPLERKLVLAAKAGHQDAKTELIAAFRPLIASVARIYRGSQGVDRLELMQEGAVGLLRALGRFDPEMGTPFWAYASWWVRQAMEELVSQLTRPVVLSDRAARLLARVKDARSEHVQTQGREPTSGELAALTSLTRDQVNRLIAASRYARPLDEPVGGDAGGGRTVADLVADPCGEDEYERVPDRAKRSQIDRLLEHVNGSERSVLRARYGLGEAPKTLRELGSSMGVSPERVRQIEQGALGKLRHAMDGPPLAPKLRQGD
jgi:RNA polymerase sigma factor (sigma-70 family)